jgi:hypothetical protein
VTALAEVDRDRLTRLLGSAYVGEVAAGRLADRLVRSAGLTWPDIIAPALRSPDRDPRADPLRGDWRVIATKCMRFLHLIDKREWRSLSGLQRFPRLSSKQLAFLARIEARLRAAGCAL